MGSLLQYVLTFSVLAKGCSSLMCVTCISNGTSCTGISVTCPSDNLCSSLYVETTNYTDEINVNIVRSCQHWMTCDKVTSLRYIGGKINIGTSCCSTDNCTPTPPSRASNDFPVNELICPSCTSSSSFCTPSESIPCIGNETVCAGYTTISSTGIQSFRGCATQRLCQIGNYSVSDSGMNVSIAFSCPDRNPGLTCTSCTTLNDTFCTGSNVTCPTGQVCASAYMKTVTEDGETVALTRSCQLIRKCFKYGTMSYSSVKFIIYTTCCVADNCSPPLAPWPSNALTANKQTCSSCFIGNSTCSSSNTIQCTGNERMCVLRTVTFSGAKSGQEVSQGCGTSSFCFFKSYSSVGGDVIINMTHSCSSHSTSLQYGILVSSVATLMMAKCVLDILESIFILSCNGEEKK